MSSKIIEIVNLLNTLASSPIFKIPRFSDQVFELYCYLKKVEEFRKNGKRPICMVRTQGVFRPLHKPGNIANGDYFRLVSNSGLRATMDIFLNGTFSGRSGIDHSPDIVVVNNGDVVTFYECKNYSSNSIGPGVYRELIGYFQEFKLRKNAYSDFFDYMLPTLYASGNVNMFQARRMKDVYNILVKPFF